MFQSFQHVSIIAVIYAAVHVRSCVVLEFAVFVLESLHGRAKSLVSKRRRGNFTDPIKVTFKKVV